jgi:FKBP-type peptidyl-prolyl cis-trans isomerase
MLHYIRLSKGVAKMKSCLKLILLLPVFLSSSVFALSLHTQQDKLSYTLGNNLGASFRENNMSLKPAIFMRGLQDGLAGSHSQLSPAEKQKVLTQYQHEMIAKIRDQVAQKAKMNNEASKKFLNANAKKSGIITTASGLQYKILKSGDGPKPKATDVVEVDYQGSLINGKVFDSSYKRGQSAKFPVNQVIAGWIEALQKMPVGSTWMLYIPAKLAYGSRGMPMAGIGPDSALIFKVHLIRIANKT